MQTNKNWILSLHKAAINICFPCWILKTLSLGVYGSVQSVWQHWPGPGEKVLQRWKLTQPPWFAIQLATSRSMTRPAASTSPYRYSGWPCRTQSTASPPAVQYNETILHHEMSALKSSRAMELSTFRTDFSLVIVTETWKKVCIRMFRLRTNPCVMLPNFTYKLNCEVILTSGIR